MNYNQFSNLSCYEEFEIQCTLTGISKVDVLKEIGNQINDYYFFISNDGIFNWFDLNGNYIEDPGILKELRKVYISKNITKCIIPDSVTCIGCEAFAYCKYLKTVYIPDNVTHIDSDAFWQCESLETITIPNNIINIGYGAFAQCRSLETITIPDSVKYIGYYAFYDCKSLMSITIPNGVINIGKSAFSFCNSLTSITIPDSVTSIGDGSFYYCLSLKEVIFKGKTLNQVEQMENYPFGIVNENIIKCEL